MTDQEYEYLKNKIYKLTNLDINCYKNQQMRRRLESYVLRTNSPTVAAFCSELEKEPNNMRTLLDYMAINVSEFFRDARQFSLLKDFVLPEIMKNQKRLNIWSAACSCGQEPYSLAILLEEMSPVCKHRIYATDIDRSALEQANNGGPYIQNDIKNVDSKLIEKYFIQNNNGYWICDKIKNKVTFKVHNLLNDPFEYDFDLIVCRNVIIYFSESVREKLYRKFHQALKLDGVLFLGGSEVVLRPSDHGFNMLHPMFYRKFPLKNNNIFTQSDLIEVRR